MAEHGLMRDLHNAYTRAIRSEKLVSLALLLILLTAASASVTSVLISPAWTSLWESLLFGLLIGWGIAIFKGSAIRAALIAIAAGLIFTFLFTSGLDLKVTAVLAELIRLGGRVFSASKVTWVDLNPLANSLRAMNSAIHVVLGRVLAWLTGLASGQAAYDPVASAFVWSMAVWIIAAWAGWIVEARRNVLIAVLPAVLLSVGTLTYARRVPITIYLILGATLVLLAAVQHDQRQQEWVETNIAYPAWKGRQLGCAAVMITIALVFLTAFISSLSGQNFMKWITEKNRPSTQQSGGLAKSLGILPAATPAPDAFQQARRPGLPRDLLVGSGPELTQRIVMSVEIKNLQNLSRGGQALPFYWRSFTYDIYTGSGWQTSDTDQSTYPAGQPLQPDHAPEHILAQQIVRPANGGDVVVYADGEPVKLNLQSSAAWRSNGDIFGIRLDRSSSYEIDSLIPMVDESTLQSTGQNYPGWVRQRYLTLPPGVPGRVKSLAIELTASAPTPYERARAIEQYLRTFPYTLNVTRPPSNQDVVDYFLFNLRKGYCDYYASAMVVLARAAGIPARLAIGYASGVYNLNSERFIVTEADAHSWAEVYFPNIGWIPFEPTAAQPQLERAQRPAPEESHGIPPYNFALTTNQTKFPPLFWLGGPALLLILGLVLGLLDEIYFRRLTEQKTVIEIYRRMRRYGALFQVFGEPGETPYEFSASLRARLQDLSDEGIHPIFWSALAEQIRLIIDRIVLASYRPSKKKAGAKSNILHIWRSLRWRLRLAVILKTWNSLRGRLKKRFTGVNDKISAHSG